jgi:hypothetical protein
VLTDHANAQRALARRLARVERLEGDVVAPKNAEGEQDADHGDQGAGERVLIHGLGEDQEHRGGDRGLDQDVDQPCGQPRPDPREGELDLDSLRRRDPHLVLILHGG